MNTDKIIKPPWYDWIETKLEPMQGLVILILVGMIAVTVWMIFQKSAALRTLWAVFLISP